MSRALRVLPMAACALLLMPAAISVAAPQRCAMAAGDTAGPVTKTTVVIYEPPIPPGPRERGSCWTGSIAVLRPGAWRCTAGNMIHDPCFSLPSLHRAVVCGADPASAKPGFVMELTKPLPPADPPAQVKLDPWIMQLADGAICEKMTGTIADVDGRAVAWGCSDSRANPKPGEDEFYSGVLENPRRGKVWMVEKVKYAPTRDPAHPLKLLGRKTVAVRRVWE